MSRTSEHRKGESFNFRIDPALKAAFLAAAEAENKPAASVLRDFMRAYVARRERSAFAAEARRQSRAVAARARDPESDEARLLRELGAILDADDFADAWKS